jgi:hypothetical protein
MRVGREREPEMPGVLRLIDGLAHRAQDHGFDELRFGATLDLREDPAQMLGRHLVEWRQLETVGSEQQREFVDPFRVRPCVHAVQPRQPRTSEALRGLDIRSNHALLDETVRRQALERPDRPHGTLLVELDLGLPETEVDRPTPLPRRGEGVVDIEQRRQHLAQAGVLATQALAVEDPHRPRIGQPCG